MVDTPTSSPDAIRGLDLLLRAVQELAMAHTLDEVVAITRTAARRLTDADGATFVLRDGDQCYYVDEDAIGPLWRGQRFPLETSLSGWSIRHKETVVIPDVYADDRVPHELYRPTFVNSLALVPIRSIDPIGAIGSYWADHHEATPEEMRLLQALADSASVAMAHVGIREELSQRVHVESELSRLSSTDDLTGLLNRRGFWERAAALLDRVRDTGSTAVIAYLDMDGLKALNDTHGHAVGDASIQAVARALTDIAGEHDIVARLGGDEFAALFVDRGPGIERLRQVMLSRLAQTQGVSASIGLCEVEPYDDLSVDALLARADALMYAEKQRRKAVSPPAPQRPQASRWADRPSWW
ncbi:MAG TPA: sensor domain-containing diguanylate cyclase [Nocardioides sp.]|uniref:sensor domain-containing diguanylate cyclase n=1 Tax=Nocardioides sp. TaxID=35761 RepID=UPI002ED7A793